MRAGNTALQDAGPLAHPLHVVSKEGVDLERDGECGDPVGGRGNPHRCDCEEHQRDVGLA